MLSVTSYSENTPAAAAAAPAPKAVTGLIHWGLLRKNMSRFWPLWVVYAVIILLMWPMLHFLTAYNFNGDPTTHLNELLAADMLGLAPNLGLFLGIVAAPLFAMAMFSYLCNGRALSMFHSFPIRRETLFVTNYLSGLLCFVPAVVLAAALSALVQMSGGGANWFAVGTSLLLVLGETFFFYSLAVFCAMFTGQILAIPVFYVIANFLVIGFYTLIQLLAQGLYFGFSGVSTDYWVQWLTPAAQLATISVFGGMRWMGGEPGMEPLQVVGLHIVGVYALVALVLAVLSLVIYRLRRSEAAGEVVVMDWARELFRYGVALCAALSLGQGAYYLLWSAFFYSTQINFPAMLVFMVLTGLLGYFAAEMLLRKSFRVLRQGRKGAVILTAGLVVLGLGMNLDVLGIEDRVPNGADVEYVYFSAGGGGGNLGAQLNDAEDVALAQALHRAILAEKDSFLSYDQNQSYLNADGGYNNLSYENCYVRVEYSMKDGSYMRRHYGLNFPLTDLDNSASAMAQLAAALSSPQFQHASLDIKNLERFTGGELELLYPAEVEGGVRSEYVSISAQQAQELYDAMQKDIDAGNFGRNYLNWEPYTKETYFNTLYFTYFDSREVSGVNTEVSDTLELRFSKNAVNLLSAMERLGLVQEEGGLMTQAQRDSFLSTYDGMQEIPYREHTIVGENTATAVIG